MRSRPWVVAAGALLPLLLVAGCSIAAPVAVTSPTPAPALVIDPSTIPIGGHPDLSGLPDGTVIATGSFTGATAESQEVVSGTIDVTSSVGHLTVSLHDLDLGPSIGPVDGAILELNARDDDASPGDFRVAYSQLGDGTTAVVAGVQQDFDIEYGDPLLTTDPSWMRTAVIWQQAGGLPYGRVLATAPLTWTLPDMRPDLAVVDTGSVAHARGTVVYDSAGNPSGYVVVSGDILEDIVARFSVEMDDLYWLNPMRGYAAAETGETINLSRYERGR